MGTNTESSALVTGIDCERSLAKDLVCAEAEGKKSEKASVDDKTLESMENSSVVGETESQSAPVKKCAICSCEARYCCPRCSLRSCSLSCVKLHKERTGCNGIRDRSAFIAMNKFTDLDLLSDYRFLEESARMVDNAVRNRIVKPHRREILPVNLSNMQKFAWKRGRTSIQFLPQTFVRRRQNRTSIKRSKIHWTIEFDLPQGQLTTTKHDIAASTSLKAVVVDLLDNLTTPQKEQVAALIQAPIGDICVLMKVVGKPANDERYFELDLDADLEENLRGKRLIEFPSLVVVTKDHLPAFRIEEAANNLDQAKQTELPSLFCGNADSDNDDRMDHQD